MSNVNVEDFSFIVLCPDRNFGGLKSTVRSIKAHFPDRPHLCVVPGDTSTEERAAFGAVCKTVPAGRTFSSLLNVGLAESKTPWSMAFMAGLPVRHGMIARYRTFCRGERHILFPVIDRKWLFHESSIHGLFLHKKAVAEVGMFEDDDNDWQSVKLLWAGKALEKGYEFRGIVGFPR